MNPLRSHKNAPLVYVCQSAVWMLYQFLQYLQWRGQVAYKVLHAVCLLRELQPLLQQERSSQGLQVKPGLCRAGVGTHMETRVDTACHWQWEPHLRAPSRRALP